MLTEKEIKHIVDIVLSHSTADQTEVLLYAADSALTRFANSYIHQNVAESDAGLSVRVVLGKKIGVASTNSLAEESVLGVVDQGLTLARLQVDNPDFVSLPGPLPIEKASCFVERTASYSPEQRAADVGIICRKARERGLVASGAFSIAVSQIAIANSLGVFASHMETLAGLETVIMSDGGSGYADCFALDAAEVNPEAIGDEAIDKAVRSQNPIALEPGEYEVVLEEYAVSDILDFLAYLGFGAQAVQEGRSFMCGRFGEKVVAENITIWDDGLAGDTIPMPFDFEGVAKQRVDFIVNGVANAVCYDSYTAAKEGKASTGHALPAGGTFGPIPMNMFLKPGMATKEEMLKSTRRGIWVTRFHYTRPVHPQKVILTGMTRDGTFLIENGEIASAIKNLRFTQGYLEALSKVEMLGRETKLEHSMFSYNRVPALKIGKWNFTGATEF